jgi:anti-sigma regulatory factor (Ser/Thr protein kinase)
MEAGIELEAKQVSVLDFELFVDGLDFLSGSERNRLKLAGSEVLDNIVKHAKPIHRCRIRARAALRGDSILLGFYFRASDFAAFAGGPWSADAEPLFDPERRRWRGLGLVMCRNLARKVTFRPGEMMDRIFLEFDLRK